MSGFFSGGVDPLWPHIILLSIAIVASASVAFGIVLENPKWSVANVLVVGGVAIEAVGTILLFGFDEGISNAQQSTIVAQQSEIIRLTTPRNLSPAAVQRVASKVCPFGAIQFDVVHVTSDEILFGNELGKIWTLCKWESRGVENPNEAVSAASEVAGIHFLYDPQHADKLKDAAEAFAAALRDENISAEAAPVANDPTFNANIIHIQLGRRP
jgi:hypothetical protein